MLELSLLGVIGLAASYWTAMWWMGRHEDVLYGDFVKSGGDGTRPALPQELPRRPRAARPALPPAVRSSAPARPAPPMSSAPIMLPARPPQSRPAVVTPPQRTAPKPPPIASNPPPRPPFAVNPGAQRPAAPAARPAPNDVLASLLETIKRDLNDAAGK